MSPSPEEQKKIDEEAKAKEAEEQAKLPYKWTQTIGDLDITVPVPGNLKGRDIIVDYNKTKIKVGIKGQTPIIDVRLNLQPLPAWGYMISFTSLSHQSPEPIPPHCPSYPSQLLRPSANTLSSAGPFPPPHPPLRIRLDARIDRRLLEERNLHPPRQDK